MRISVKNSDELRTCVDRCMRLFDCYDVPPEIDGIQLTHAYLEGIMQIEGDALVIDDGIAGGVFGDITGQLFHILQKYGQIKPDTVVEYNDKSMTYEVFKNRTPQRYADMAVHEINDDPDSDCFRGRKHLLDMFWEGCIEQTAEWDQDD